jgi:phosphoribosyl 1,2-cyclic phosphodiesterase
MDTVNFDLFRQRLSLVSLASGSGGNASVVTRGDAALLIDCGISCKRVRLRMAQAGLSEDSLRGILVTHEHSDHVAGVRVTAKRLGLPVYMARAAAEAHPLPAEVDVRLFEPGEVFSVAGFEVDPYCVPHDTVDPVGFVIRLGDQRVGICTDLGSVTRLVIDKLRQCSVVLLEFNHDVELLLEGPYPWNLKQRVRSRHGHLSNEQAGALLAALGGGPLESVFLAHLSEKNNRPDLALSAAREALQSGHKKPVRIEILAQDGPGPLVTVGGVFRSGTATC